MLYHAHKLQSQVICIVGLTIYIALASCSARGATDNRSFAPETTTARTRTETQPPEPTDTPLPSLPPQPPTFLPTTASPAAPDDETIAALITLTCFSHGVADVQVTVGQAEGGQKGAIVTLQTDTGDLEEVAAVAEAVLRAVHQVNSGDVRADLDFVSMVIGDAVGRTAMTITVPMPQLEAWMAGEITHEEFIATWIIKDF